MVSGVRLCDSSKESVSGVDITKHGEVVLFTFFEFNVVSSQLVTKLSHVGGIGALHILYLIMIVHGSHGGSLGGFEFCDLR